MAEKKELPKAKIVTNFDWKIPDCCRLGLPSCPHVLKKPRKSKKNVGL